MTTNSTTNKRRRSGTASTASKAAAPNPKRRPAKAAPTPATPADAIAATVGNPTAMAAAIDAAGRQLRTKADRAAVTKSIAVMGALHSTASTDDGCPVAAAWDAFTDGAVVADPMGATREAIGGLTAALAAAVLGADDPTAAAQLATDALAQLASDPMAVLGDDGARARRIAGQAAKGSGGGGSRGGAAKRGDASDALATLFPDGASVAVTYRGTKAVASADGVTIGKRTFDSPSGAAKHVAGRAQNGWEAWRDDDGATLAQLYAAATGGAAGD